MNRFLILLLCLAVPFLGIAQKQSAKNKATSISSVGMGENVAQWMIGTIDNVRLANDIPALSVGIIQSRAVILAKGFGVRNLKDNIKVNHRSLYQIGSDTKKMTGIIAKNLANEGIIKLNEPMLLYLITRQKKLC
ncbi:MAG: serine hydrolase [Bacteroidota bacterium]